MLCYTRQHYTQSAYTSIVFNIKLCFPCKKTCKVRVNFFLWILPINFDKYFFSSNTRQLNRRLCIGINAQQLCWKQCVGARDRNRVWTQGDLNPWPLRCKRSALPTELWAQLLHSVRPQLKVEPWPTFVAREKPFMERFIKTNFSKKSFGALCPLFDETFPKSF